MEMSGIMSSNRHDWETPEEVINKLPVYFDVDVCATPETAKAKKFYTPQQDGLKRMWKGVCWMNPPYGKELPRWLQKAYDESRTQGTSVWCLVPARTDTKWFHEIATLGTIVFLKRRVPFLMDGKPVRSPPFPSMVVIFDKDIDVGFLTWDWKFEKLILRE